MAATLPVARRIAALAAAGAAALYLLIGLGVVRIGESAAGGTPDLLGFGATLGALYLATAILLMRSSSPVVWAAIALFQVVVIVGYFAFSSLREPPIEMWGLLIKACQAGVLAVAGYVVLGQLGSRAGHARRRTGGVA
jgi:hypothetical protein